MYLFFIEHNLYNVLWHFCTATKCIYMLGEPDKVAHECMWHIILTLYLVRYYAIYISTIKCALRVSLNILFRVTWCDLSCRPNLHLANGPFFCRAKYKKIVCLHNIDQVQNSLTASWFCIYALWTVLTGSFIIQTVTCPDKRYKCIRCSRITARKKSATNKTKQNKKTAIMPAVMLWSEQGVRGWLR